MSQPAAILVAALIACAVFAAVVALAARLDPPRRGRHVPFADPEDRTDPDGVKWIARITPDELPAPDPRTLAELARGLHGTGWLEALPDDPLAEPPVTGTGELAAIGWDLGMPTDAYVTQLFDKYAEMKP